MATARIPTPLGELIAGASDRGVTFLEFPERSESISEPASRAGDSRGIRPTEIAQPNRSAAAGGHLTLLADELARYFARKLHRFSVPLDVRGTAFQERVWRALLEIPFGETRSYEAIARGVASAEAVRAVGTANGRNPIAIVIPCHRVINKSGRLGGYGGGLWRKEWLLDLESGHGALDRTWLASKEAGSSRPAPGHAR